MFTLKVYIPEAGYYDKAECVFTVNRVNMEQDYLDYVDPGFGQLEETMTLNSTSLKMGRGNWPELTDAAKSYFAAKFPGVKLNPATLSLNKIGQMTNWFAKQHGSWV